MDLRRAVGSGFPRRRTVEDPAVEEEEVDAVNDAEFT
jgi:hypothetical protein